MPKSIPLLAIALVVVLSVHLGCGRKDEPESASRPEAVTIAVSPQPVSAAIYVAQDKGFFEQEGLQVTLQSHASGKAALNAVIGGEAQIGTTAETPIMIAGLQGEKFFVLGTVAESNRYMKIIARKDRGIATPADLKGKTIGVSSGTNGEFFLHVYLTLHHLAQKDVQAVSVRPDAIVDALASGKVDAVSTWAPHTTLLENQLGGNALVLHDPGIYAMTWNVAATRDFVQSHPGQIEKFLRVVIRATTFIKEQPDEARSITAKHIGMDMDMLSEIWALYDFNIVLDQSLILNLEDQARWMMKQEVGDTTTAPNFLDFMYTDGLKKVQPNAVRIAGK
jgi:NitT/TauT family transport system substrate-binding protein